ncbi:MAG: DUF4153 domain-containing protein [Acidimicrobiales bacterium]
MTASSMAGRAGVVDWLRPLQDLDLSGDRPADGRVLVAAALGGVVVDFALRSGVVGVAGALAVLVAAAGLVGSGRVANPQARALAATAPLFGVWLALRTSPWLIAPDVLAAGGLLLVAASLARGGSVLDLTFPRAAVRAAIAAVHGAVAPLFLLQPLAARRHVGARFAAVGRGVLLAIPVVAVIGLLLGSADPFFAAVFDGPDNVPSLIGHVVLIVGGAWAMAGLLRMASARSVPEPPTVTARLGATEAIVVLGALVALFVVFAGAQVVAVSHGAKGVLETAGLTYAEYARSGYFQLLAVAGLTLLTLLGIRAVTAEAPRRQARALEILAEVAVVLTLVVLASAVRRLALYETAYGLTMLRLYSVVFAGWLALVLALAGVSIAGLWDGRRWFLSAAVGAGLVVLLTLNAVNPEVLVVSRNLDRARSGRPIDVEYLAALADESDDAVPVLADRLSDLDVADRASLADGLACAPDEGWHGWGAANLARHRARALCVDVTPRR